MDNRSINLKLTLWLAAIGFMAGHAQPVAAQDLNIAQSPLFVAANVEPNVMFTLDDSGSMQWEYMPDGGEFRFTLHMFPRPAGLYGGQDYDNQVPSFRDDSLHNYFGRSAANNGVFYNPDVTYRPWSSPDGSEMPQADPTAALYNPDRPGLGALDLTREQTETAIWFRGDNFNQGVCDPCGGNHTYWPITYYNYTGGDRTARGSYQRVRITDSTAAGVTFTSPGGVTRARDAEIQNFANWFQYHRSRILTSRGAIGRAFTQMPDEARVGFAAINQGSREIDGVDSDGALITGVSAFDGEGREKFYDRLYGRVLNRQGTPLRRAAQRVGEYFERDDSRGPWSTTPGAGGGQDLACRQSFHILMTDGFWNGDDPSVGNSDGTAGTPVLGPDIGEGVQSFNYAPVPPFSDAATNTLADVAMHYWKRDLRPDVDNRVPPTDENPAFWQHLASFGIGLGVEGNVDPETAFDAIDSLTAINWGNPFANNPAKIDDLLHFGLNGRGGFFTARDPESFATELGNLLLDIVSRTSATAGISVSSTRLTEASTVFGSEFDTADWSGNIEAIGENSWPSPTFDGHADRDVLTSTNNGTGGTEFSNATAGSWPVDQIVPVVPGSTRADVVNFIRGDQSNEGEGGPFEFRERSSLLGDIVNSRPAFVGQRNEGWARLPAGQGGGTTYAAFVEDKADYEEALYVGANDGMMHAFSAETGREFFAYVPRAVLPKLAELTNPDYSHQFYVDGQISVQDAFSGSWRRVLVGTLGAGGRGVYAIDVTDPNNPNVLWELTSEEDEDLGFTYGAPVITRIGSGG
ncbi:MAG: pilus assembly protein, partial [Wenzhouxiangellaceae bacterium]